MNIVAIIQARMGSTRLPGKILLDIEGKPMLWHVVNRLKHNKLINEIVIATTNDKKDEKTVNFCKDNKIYCYRGSQEDVLDRYYQGAKDYNADIVVRITSDCPLIDPAITDEVISCYLDNQGNIDYVSNTIKRTYPWGMDTEVISFKALEKCWQEAKEKHQREHVTPYIYEHPGIFNLMNLENKEDLCNLRLTVDEKKDLELVRKIYAKLYKGKDIFFMEDIIKLLENSPELREINRDIKQKAFKQ